MNPVTFNLIDPKFMKNVIVNPERSIALGLANIVISITGLTAKAESGGGEFGMKFALRRLGLRITQNGTFQVKFPQHLRTKAAPLVDGNVVIDPETKRPKRIAALDGKGNEVWDEDYCPITDVTRAAITTYCSHIPGVAEAMIEGRDQLAAKLGVETPAPQTDAGAVAEPTSFSV